MHANNLALSKPLEGLHAWHKMQMQNTTLLYSFTLFQKRALLMFWTQIVTEVRYGTLQVKRLGSMFMNPLGKKNSAED